MNLFLLLLHPQPNGRMVILPVKHQSWGHVGVELLLMRMMITVRRLRETGPVVNLISKVRVSVEIRLRIVGILEATIGHPTNKPIEFVVLFTKIQRSWPNVPKKRKLGTNIRQCVDYDDLNLSWIIVT